MDSSDDDKLSPRFKQAHAHMLANRLSGPRATDQATLVTIAETLEKSFEDMDDYLGLKRGSYQKWVKTAPKEPPAP